MQINLKKIMCYTIGIVLGGGAIAQAIHFGIQGCDKIACTMWGAIGVIIIATFIMVGNEK